MEQCQQCFSFWGGDLIMDYRFSKLFSYHGLYRFSIGCVLSNHMCYVPTLLCLLSRALDKEHLGPKNMWSAMKMVPLQFYEESRVLLHFFLRTLVPKCLNFHPKMVILTFEYCYSIMKQHFFLILNLMDGTAQIYAYTKIYKDNK